ncbi:Tryptophan--tRNA ligase [Microbacterium oxydans]|uniref:tryptophan--tRNA ligase n=1 Tax=Microbacterium oxydans TaxID=82380 RepID=A0A3S9WNY7_9MICO|nr:Tryptophan--tRNA ligase [Microbacterium oxydans]
MTRVIARRFNERYGAIFPIPEALITATPEVPGLDGRKMSKSYGNAIALSMTADETVAVIRRTRTDQDRRITFDPERRPGVSALLSTAALCLGAVPEELAAAVGDGGSGELKALTATVVNDFLAPLRARRRELAVDGDLVRSVLQRGNEHARAIADVTLDEVRAAMGTVY